MYIRAGFEIEVECPAPVPMILALGVHPEANARIVGEDRVRLPDGIDTEVYSDYYQNRMTRLVAPAGTTTLWSDFFAVVDGAPDIIAPDAVQNPVEKLPVEVLDYLAASRYCPSDELSDFAWQQFGHISGGWNRAQAICNFAHNHITFGYQFARPTKTATDVLREKAGVCRDFAHLLVSLCRAINIPARYASGYLGDIGWPDSGPGDFCAWVELYLDDRWYTFDARYNAPRIGRILMVRGHDASDVAMMTCFGNYQLNSFRVWTQEVSDIADDESALSRLGSLPETEALVSASSGRR